MTTKAAVAVFVLASLVDAALKMAGYDTPGAADIVSIWGAQ